MTSTARLACASFCASPARSCVEDRSLLIADHPRFLEIDADRRQIFRDIADVPVLVRPDRILQPITRSSAAVTISLEADESAVGMITSLVPHGARRTAATG